MFIDQTAGLGQAARMNWLEIKIWLEATSGLDRDALHIYGAVGIQLLFALFFKRSLASLWPWLFAFAAALANEYVDFQQAGTNEASIAIYKDESIHDLWNTMLLPTGLLLIARFWPKWLVGVPKPVNPTTEEAEIIEIDS